MIQPYEPRRVPRSRRTSLRGLMHQLTEWPGREPEPIVLLHGFLDTGSTFQFLADALDERWTLVAPDLRGFGGSDWPADGYWFPDYFADLEALLDELSPGRPVTLIGHSMGGNIAMIYAGVRPERVSRLVSLEGFGLPATRSEQSPERIAKWLDQVRGIAEVAEFPSLDAFALMLQRRNPRLRADRAAWIAKCWAAADAEGRVRARFDPVHKRVNPVLYRREESEACWRRIAAPTLYVVGGESEFLKRVEADGRPENLAAIVPQIENCLIPGAGHMLHHEQPEALGAEIERFLRAGTRRESTGAGA